MVVVLVLAVSNRGTVPIADTVLQALALVARVPAAYLFYSVQRYFGFLSLWVPALCVALFNPIFIWVHYVSTERPDMRRIYAADPGRIQ